MTAASPPIPAPARRSIRSIDLAGRVVMAGGIDIHSHICGGKVNLARTLMPAEHRDASARGAPR